MFNRRLFGGFFHDYNKKDECKLDCQMKVQLKLSISINLEKCENISSPFL